MSVNLDARMLTRLTEAQLNQLFVGNPHKLIEGGIMTGVARLSWPSLSKPAKPQNPNQTPKYQVNLIFPGSVGFLAAQVEAAIKQHYPTITDPKVLMDPKNKNHPLKDQGLKVNVADGGLEPIKQTTGGYIPGKFFITAKSNRQPGCFRTPIVNGRPTVVLPEEIEPLLYPGCWVVAKVVLLKSSAAGNPGVSWGLQSIMKVADDTPFGGGEGGGTNASPDDFGGAAFIEDPNAILVPNSASAGGSSWD